MALLGFVLLAVAAADGASSCDADYCWIVKEDVAAPDGYPRRVIAVIDQRHMHYTANRLNDSNAFNDVRSYDGPQPLPGPTLRVRRGQRVTVSVENRLPTTEVSIHWHGVHMLRQAWMDGTAGVTGCSIPAGGGRFTYNFTVDQEPGTHWWHSHVGAQYGDGVFGVIIIDPADAEILQDEVDGEPFVLSAHNDPVYQATPYTDDQILTVQEWFHESYYDLSARYKSRIGDFVQFNKTSNESMPFLPDYPWPSSYVLLNGRGQTSCEFRTWEECTSVRDNGWNKYFHKHPDQMLTSEEEHAAQMTLTQKEAAQQGRPTGTAGQCMPERRPLMGRCNPDALPSELHCTPGGSTRVRLVNTGISMPLRFWIDRHTFTVVARDGVAVEPTGPHETLALGVGQRLDIVVSCDQSPKQRYKAFGMIALREYYPGSEHVNYEASSFAVLAYSGDAPFVGAGLVTVHGPKWCSGNDAVPVEPLLQPKNFSTPGRLKGNIVEANPRHALYASWQIPDSSYVPWVLERLPPLQPRGDKLRKARDRAAPAEERFVLSINGNGNWWANRSDVHNYIGLKEEWWSMNEGDLGNNYTWNNSKHPLCVPNEPVMIGKLFGRDFAELYGTSNSTLLPMIKKLRYNRDAPVTYEVVMINYEGQQHPWHIHGHTIDVVAQGWLDPACKWHSNFTKASFNPASFLDSIGDYDKPRDVLYRVDTWTTPPHSYVVFRLTANNPGAWMMHCHMDLHLEAGMGMLWSVEADDGSYPLPLPPDDFPVCSRTATLGAALALQERVAVAPVALGQPHREQLHPAYYVLAGLACGFGLAMVVGMLPARRQQHAEDERLLN